MENINKAIQDYLALVGSEHHDVVSVHVSSQRSWNKNTNKYDIKYILEVNTHDGQWRETKMDGDDLYKLIKTMLRKFPRKVEGLEDV